MNAKTKIAFVCTACGSVQPKWSGKCPECGAWNTMVEEKVVKRSEKVTTEARREPQPLTAATTTKIERSRTGIEEFDRVLGGGFVNGSVILISGEPGIGKSTIILQVLEKLKGEKFLYFTGEESEEQIRLRAERLAIRDPRIWVASENNLENILYQMENHRPSAIVIDSVQTVYSDAYENVPGSVTQVRECAGRLLRKAKELGIIAVFIGHITKDGMIAGPKVLEHLVDTVLYLEGDKQNFYRLLRSMKNRFGPTNEVGIFEMKETGLIPVGNPSDFFLSERREHVAGSAIAVSMEGTRPFLIEVQALVTQTTYGTPQRTANGIDYRRLAMLIAVLEKRAGFPLRTQDVFVNLVGGLKIDETAINLGLVAAMASSFRDIPLDPMSVFIGEVGLVGEVRSVPFIEQRVKEAVKFGYQKIYVPKHNLRLLKNDSDSKIIGVDSINHLLGIAL
ncbi:MAG: DNA repair protein RadA [Candidatus Marinimicrobia bacterium CG08_land_8_20_14_0_20_45_22]|nr:MAG: DNA repair protein RadA [Candidatus Marinimicrobia bacterium CG08_land_8_20_14_0_20_45_22]